MKKTALLLLLCFAACDQVNAAAVMNNTGHTISVLHVSETGNRNETPMRARWSWPSRWQVRIASGEGANLRYNIFHEWIVEIEDAGCSRWYKIPVDPSGAIETTVQLESDHLLYAIPYTGDEHTIDLTSLTHPQPTEFPIHPSEEHCS